MEERVLQEIFKGDIDEAVSYALEVVESVASIRSYSISDRPLSFMTRGEDGVYKLEPQTDIWRISFYLM